MQADWLPDVDATIVETPRGPVLCSCFGPESGPLIIALHGWGSSSRGWQYMYKPLASLGFRIIGPEMPFGHSSDAATTVTSRSKDNAVAGGPVDVLLAIVRTLLPRSQRSDTVLLMGYSWGGGVCLSFTLQYPALVSRLVLFHVSYTDTDAQLTRVQHPVLVLWVKEDTMHVLSTGRKIAAALPRACPLVCVSVGAYSREKAQRQYERYADRLVPHVVAFCQRELQTK